MWGRLRHDEGDGQDAGDRHHELFAEYRAGQQSEGVARPDVVCFRAEYGIRDLTVTGVQTCALPISDLHIGTTLSAIAPPDPLPMIAGDEPTLSPAAAVSTGTRVSPAKPSTSPILALVPCAWPCRTITSCPGTMRPRRMRPMPSRPT